MPTGKVQGHNQIVTVATLGRGILHPLEEDSWLSREFEMTPMSPRPVTTISPSRATPVHSDPRENLDAKVVNLDSEGSPRDVTHSTEVQGRELALEQIAEVHVDSQHDRVESHMESRQPGRVDVEAYLQDMVGRGQTYFQELVQTYLQEEVRQGQEVIASLQLEGLESTV